MTRSTESMMLFLTILLMEILMGIELEICVPSFPELREIFNLSPFMIQLVLSANFIAYCLAALVVGMIGDIFNRKRVIVYSLIVFIIGSIVAIGAEQYSAILVGRVLQGIGIAGPAALGYTVLADLYPPSKQINLIGLIHCFVGFAIAGAPVMGSYITSAYGWRGNFVALLLLGILSLLMTFKFVQSNESKTHTHSILRNYWVLLTSKRVLLYCLAISFLINPYIVFVGFSAVLYIQDFGASLRDFSLYQGALGLIFAVSSAFSGTLTEKLGRKKCFQISMAMLCLHLIAVVALVILESRSPLLITVAMAIASTAVSIPLNVLIPYGMEAAGNSKGGISALMLALRLIFSAISLWIVGYMYDGTFVPLGIAIVIMMGIAMISTFVLLKTEPELLNPRKNAL